MNEDLVVPFFRFFFYLVDFFLSVYFSECSGSSGLCVRHFFIVAVVVTVVVI